MDASVSGRCTTRGTCIVTSTRTTSSRWTTHEKPGVPLGCRRLWTCAAPLGRDHAWDHRQRFAARHGRIHRPGRIGQPHAVTEAADVHSLGRVLGWLTTGEDPVLTRPLLPNGPWRSVVRNFTFDAPLHRPAHRARRPQTMSETLTKSHELRADLPTSEKAHLRMDLREKGAGLKADNPLWDVALEHLDDHAS